MITLDLDLSLAEEIVDRAANKLQTDLIGIMASLEKTMSKPEAAALLTIRTHEKLIEIVAEETDESILAMALLKRFDLIVSAAVTAPTE